MRAGVTVVINYYRINSKTQGKPTKIENKNNKKHVFRIRNKKKIYKIDTSTIGKAKQTKEKQ